MSIQQLTLAEIAAIFRRHRGVPAQIARELAVRPATLSNWMSGRIGSKRIEALCRERAQALLAVENKAA